MRRSGASLTEVLMAILIMGVGVVSVFTLFPISVLRTVQATNQTNAKILKENVEEQVSQSPILLTTFSSSGAASPIAGLSMMGEWTPGFNYNANEIVTPTMKPGSSRPSMTFFIISTAGQSGLVEPQWQATGQTSDGSIVWDRFNLSRYIVDPLGLTTAIVDGQTADVADTFGNKTNRASGVATAFATSPLLRFHGGRSTPFDAADVCTHPDNWQELLNATPESATATSVTFPATTDLAGFYPASPSFTVPRVVMTSGDGNHTVVRQLSGPPAGQVLNWVDPLPLRFLVADVGVARIEVFNRRYSWFITVRNVGARPEIKCVVTFNRSFLSADEHAYDANFGNDAADVDGAGGPDGAQHGLSANRGDWVKVAWDSATEPDPLLKPGNWLFDGRDASWYRIQEVFSQDAAFAVLILGASVRSQTPSTGPQFPGRAILLPGIVEVFDL